MGASASHVSNSKISDTSHQDVSGGIYLTGWVLTIARLIWVTLSLIVTGLVIWSLSVRTFSEVELPIYFLMPLGYFAISLIIFWRKSDDLVGLLTSLMLIFFGPYLISGVNIWVSEQPGWEIFGAVMVGIGATLVIFFLFLFPDGRFVPGWTRWFTLIASILIIISSFITIWPNFSMGADRINGTFIWNFLVAYPRSTGIERISRDSIVGNYHPHPLCVFVVNTFASPDAGFLNPALPFVGY
jgi:hypothetical protein